MRRNELPFLGVVERLAVAILILMLPAFSVACESSITKNLEQEIKSLSERYFIALDSADVRAIGQLTLEDFVAVQPDGRLRTKSAILEAYRARPRSDRRSGISRSWLEINVRSFGDAALLSGVLEVKGTGIAEPIRGARTLTWIRRASGWQLAHDQWTPALGAGEAGCWNAVYLGYSSAAFNVQPNSLLVETVKKLHPGKALDVGMGEGRNAVFLATRGWAVTGFDPAEAGLAVARRHALQANVAITPILQGMEEFDWGRDRWDLIALLYVPFRGYVNEVREALKPGGMVVVEAFHREAARGHKIGNGVVFDSGELRDLFASGFEIMRYEEPVDVADFGMERVRLVRLVARKK